MSEENPEVTDDLKDGQTSDQSRAAEKRAAANATEQPSDPYVGPLLEERRGYAMHGRADRVAEVDEQLRLRGVEPPADATGEGKRTATRGGRGRGRTAKA
jgi:hypothetical protein